MPVHENMSLLSLISNASLLVKLVMALLMLVSAMSWTYIFRKMFTIRSATRQTGEFETAFCSGANLNALYEELTTNRRRGQRNGALERIFEAGMEEYRKARVSFSGKDIDGSTLLDGARPIRFTSFPRDGALYEQLRGVDAVARIAAVPTILEAVARTTGMRFSAVARVTDTTWTACAVHDTIDFGLRPGSELVLETTICNEIRQHRQAVIFGHASQHPHSGSR